MANEETTGAEQRVNNCIVAIVFVLAKASLGCTVGGVEYFYR